MGIKINTKPRTDLALLSINAAEDIQRLNKKMPTNLKHAKELSEIIKSNIDKTEYSARFLEAYCWTYSKENSPPSEKILKQYMESTYKKLDSPLNLKKEELKELVSFCARLSDSFSLHEQEINSYRDPCFR